MKRFLQTLSLAIMAGTLVMAASAAATDRKTIRAAFIEFPPLAYSGADGHPEGSFIHFTEELARRAGYEVAWQGLPIERVYLYLERGDIDLWPGSAGVPELAGFTHETDFRPGEIRLNAYHRGDTPPVKSLEDLQGKRLILIRGYTYFRLLDELKVDPNTYVTLAPDHQSAIRMLAFRRGDYLVNFQAPMEVTIERSPLPDLAHTNLLSWPLSFIFSASAPGTRLMARRFNQAWQELQGDDTTAPPDN
ncbi:polar amino acid transport system substrate-binding protein [Marinobacter segnicrescens]|uniref:Polar amino acid transport system substrate-binding protein n=2 Tax=Marinobacteraceae TaxID=2887365 RepID=A0A1H9YKQ1_9GAMM|nr:MULTISPECIES: transporter substrate-binding domain-containing protein [Marinobacter]UZD67678.1 transporter substrate-binding domain-containing protein [Marinobacter sp. AN1]SES69639.1 polar amino acid transport system substrate-binding protein [Marinobacter segnicrescens]